MINQHFKMNRWRFYYQIIYNIYRRKMKLGIIDKVLINKFKIVNNNFFNKIN